MRMIDSKTQRYLGKCLFSNMFAVPYKEVKKVQLEQYDDYIKNVMQKKIEYLFRNRDRVEKAAQRIYKQKNRGYQQEYLKNTLDFMAIEQLAFRWEMKKYGKHYNRFPDKDYFIVNARHEGVSEYFLMNKEQKIAKISFDNKCQIIMEVLEIINVEYAPLECFKNKQLDKDEITKWFKGRGIPTARDGLDDLLDNLGVKDKDILLNKAYGLSLSDQYWMNPIDGQMDWKDINFFDHNFNSHIFIEATFDSKLKKMKEYDFYSPNNTSDGMLKKAWVVGEDQCRYLLKGAFKEKVLEPFNEVIASKICEVIGLDHTQYDIEVLDCIVLSKCRCFIDKNTELLSAYAIMKYYGVDMSLSNHKIHESYISILKQNGLLNVEQTLAKMFVLDYLLVNQDRHLGNFGVIRNVHTLKWEKIAPIYDSGQSMYSQREYYEMNFHQASGCFFQKKMVDFEKILDMMLYYCDIHIDFNKLEEIPNQYEILLIKYQSYTMIDNNVISVLVEGLRCRICKLKQRFIN